MSRRKIALALTVLLGIGIYVVIPKSNEGKIGPPATPPYLTIFLVDGFSTEVFRKELAKGHLPNLKAMIDGGTYVPNGVCAFPSMTAYGFYGFITGRDAPSGGPLGLRWFDRTQPKGPFRRYVGRTHTLLNDDMVPTERTLFEKFGEQHSFSMNSYANRGVWKSVKTGGLFTMTKYREHWWVAKLVSSIGPLRDRFGPGWHEVERRIMGMAIEDLDNKPKIQWITLVSPDTFSHVHGLTDEYAGLLVNLDALIGEYVAAAKVKDDGAPRYYAVVGDHGVENVDKHFAPGAVFREAGLNAYRGPATHLLEDDLEDARESYEEYDAVIAINGNLMAYVYTKAPGSPAAWSRPPTYEELTHYQTPQGPKNLIDLYLAQEGIEHVISRRTATEFEVASREGVGLVNTSSAGFSYRVIQGKDPLGYASQPALKPLLGLNMYPAETWMRASIDSEFPHGVVRIARLMLHPGAGDLVVTSAKLYDLAPDFELFVGEYKGGHGGLRKDQILAPFIISGPGVHPQRVPIATAEDVGATLHDLLQAPLSPHAEGRSLQSRTAQ